MEKIQHRTTALLSSSLMDLKEHDMWLVWIVWNYRIHDRIWQTCVFDRWFIFLESTSAAWNLLCGSYNFSCWDVISCLLNLLLKCGNKEQLNWRVFWQLEIVIFCKEPIRNWFSQMMLHPCFSWHPLILVRKFIGLIIHFPMDKWWHDPNFSVVNSFEV